MANFDEHKVKFQFNRNDIVIAKHEYLGIIVSDKFKLFLPNLPGNGGKESFTPHKLTNPDLYTIDIEGFAVYRLDGKGLGDINLVYESQLQPFTKNAVTGYVPYDNSAWLLTHALALLELSEQCYGGKNENLEKIRSLFL